MGDSLQEAKGGDMTDYVVRFDVAPVDDATEDRLLEDGRFSVSTRAGKWTIEAEVSGQSPVEAAKSVALDLLAYGVTVNEALPELVTMADIARRAEVSKQSVSNWANRLVNGDHFPRPWNSTDTTLIWDWCYVNEWLRSRGHSHYDWETLTTYQAGQVNDWLSAQQIPRRPADGALRPRPLNQVVQQPRPWWSVQRVK